MKLSQLEYGVLMQAIVNAQEEDASGDFFDPYSNEEGLTQEQVTEALKSVEKKIYDFYLQVPENV